MIRQSPKVFIHGFNVGYSIKTLLKLYDTKIEKYLQIVLFCSMKEKERLNHIKDPSVYY